jgi:hypothetical protein
MAWVWTWFLSSVCPSMNKFIPKAQSTQNG